MLASPQVVDSARKATAKRILLDLRNALAHGGVAYLDEDGRNAYGPAAMFVFVASARSNGQFIGLNILCIHESGFDAFLTAWTDWLSQQIPVLQALNERSEVAA